MDKIIDFIVIGRNVEKTIVSCLEHLLDLKLSNGFMIGEIFYIDGQSDDESLNLVSKFKKIKIIKIESNFLTASLGRRVGMDLSNSEFICFLDADMDLIGVNFNILLKYLSEHNALISDRHEVLYNSNNSIDKIIPFFYDFGIIRQVKKIGGFLLAKRSAINDAHYKEILVDEEETDFYSQFYSKNKIFCVPVEAYKHNNYNRTSSRIRNYISFRGKTGHIISFFLSIKNGYFLNFLKLQRNYSLTYLLWVLSFLTILIDFKFGIYFFILSLLILLLIKKSLPVVFMFLPYKLISATLILFFKKQIKVFVKNH